MNDEYNDEYILNTYWKNKHCTLKRSKDKLSKNEIDYLLNRFDDCEDIFESIYRIKHNIDECPKCPICGKNIPFKRNVYNEYCSKQCSNKNPKLIEHRKQTLLERYGTDIPCRNEQINQKLRKSLKNVDFREINSRPRKKKNKKEKIKKIRTEQDKINTIEKRKSTCIKRYGVDNYTKTDECKTKIKQTCLERYGIESVLSLNRNINNTLTSKESRNKAINTSIERFGKNNINNRNKAKETCLKRYGVTNKRKLESSKREFGKIMSSKEVQDKRNKTFKENKSWNISKPEQQSYELLKQIFPDVIYQYRDERYPWNSDFYIPSLDLFIECQYSWTHGGHPYQEKEDKEKLELWESKNTQYYKNAINTWTNRDVKKRETAKLNNLNYLEFFSFEEFKNWLMSLNNF